MIRLNQLSQPVVLVSGVVTVAMLWGVANSESPFLTVAAGLVIILAVKLLWRSGEPPTLLLLAGLHLMQVTTALFYANALGVHMNSLSEYGVNLEGATWVALGGVLCLILGMSLGNAGPAIWSPTVAQAEARKWSPRSAFRFFLVTLVIGVFFGWLSLLSEAVRQLFLAAAGIQWIGIYVLAYVCLSQKRGISYLLTAVGIEVALGFTGFFSEFKVVFFVLFIAFASARPKLNILSVVAIAVTAVFLFVLSGFWSGIKDEYRSFVNKGSQAQVVLVPLEDRFAFLADRVSEADENTLAKGFDLLLRRMTYVEFFGATLNYVPDARPHESGMMTLAAISHILAPRLIVPDKAILPNDTMVTMIYTGLPLPKGEGTSISIGYAGELYIDFGVFGMMACMGILGFLYGKANRYVQGHFGSALIGYGATIVLLMPGFYFETSLPKTLGGVGASFVVLLLMSKFVLPFALNVLAWKERKASHRPSNASITKHQV